MLFSIAYRILAADAVTAGDVDSLRELLAADVAVYGDGDDQKLMHQLPSWGGPLPGNRYDVSHRLPACE